MAKIIKHVWLDFLKWLKYEPSKHYFRGKSDGS